MELLHSHTTTQSHWSSGSIVCFPPMGQPFATMGCTHTSGTGIFLWRDIPTHTKHPQNFLSTVTIYYCDNFLLWHFNPKWVDCLSTSKMDSLSQCDTLTCWNFGQPMAVTFCPILILIFVVVFAFQKTLAWNLRLFRDYSTRFSDPGRILARDVW